MPHFTSPPSVYYGTRSQSSPRSVVVTGNSFAAGSAGSFGNQPPASYLAGTSAQLSWISGRTANSVPGVISSARRSGGFTPGMLLIRPPGLRPYRVHKRPSHLPQGSFNARYASPRSQLGQGFVDDMSQYLDYLPQSTGPQSENMSYMQPISQTQSYPGLQAERPPFTAPFREVRRGHPPNRASVLDLYVWAR
jgi:hypothetical protein